MMTPSQGRMLVVVEDDPSMSKALERILRAGGFSATLFNSAEDALSADEVINADCLVLDIQLPGMSGFDFYRTLLQSGANLPVVFITAHDAPAVRAEAERLRPGSYLPKPFMGRALVDAVRLALGSP